MKPTASDPGLHLLLAYADDPLPIHAAPLPPTPPAHDSSHHPLIIKDPQTFDPLLDDLAEGGWCVICPEGQESDLLLAAIAPLIAHREAELLRPALILRPPPALLSLFMKSTPTAPEASDALDAWVAADGPLPRYLLLLGDLHELPLQLTHALAARDHAVGRLAFAEPAAYRDYALKICTWEHAPPDLVPPVLLHTVREGSPATRVAHRGLIAPLLARARQDQRRGRLAAQILELGDPEEPSADDLLESAELPGALLLTAGRAHGPPRQGWRSPAAQRRGQGAMSFGHAGSLRAGDLRDRPFMPGGFWWMHTSFALATPERSAYEPWLAAQGEPAAAVLAAARAAAPSPGASPFFAALALAALQNPSGPLAVFGPADLAWSYTSTTRVKRLYPLLRALLRGARLGRALRPLRHSPPFTEPSQLAPLAALEADPVTPPDPHTWLIAQELSSYILLGDPAVRLPSAQHLLQQGRPAAKEKKDPDHSPVDLRLLEAAILAHLSGDESTLEDPLLAPIARDRAQLARYSGAYAEAGRLALERLLAAPPSADR